MNTKSIATVSRWSRIGLWGSVAAVLAAALFHYLSPYRFTASAHSMRWALIAGSLLAVLAISMALLTTRRRIPQLRQSDSLDDKLSGYAAHIRSLYGGMLAVVIVLCLFAVLFSQNVLLMLAIVAVLTLFLSYPNIYRIKVDLGLSDEQMQSLFGNRYIPSDGQPQ